MENIREISMDTLMEILEKGQFSHIYLKQVLDKYAYFDKNERSFINRLVNGTIERKIELDYIIDSYSKTKVKKMKPLIRTMLRMGAFELYYMDSVPDSATCNEYVKLAKKRGFSGLSGFVNGVLRNISRGKDNLTVDDSAVKYSMPQWIYDKWAKDYGKEKADEICQSFFEPQELCIRVNTSLTTSDKLLQILTDEGIKARQDATLESALYISNFDRIANIDAFNKGLFYIQDYSSQLVCHYADIARDAKVLDVCAAPGGKALHAASYASEGSVEARDITEAKVALIQENITRSKATNIKAMQWDATILDENAIEAFDVVIADLPCSGLGIIRKKPDIKYNQTAESLDGLVTLQANILDVVSRYVKAGGTLVYSTCTINEDENKNQIKNFLSSHKEFTILRNEQLFATKEHDGFYICVMKK